jgi:hypothetical protein
MAIKGKSRPKGGGKAPARGPKPAYVPVSKRIWQRRAFWVTVLVVFGLAAIAGLWYGLAKQRTTDREEALAQDLSEATTAYQQQVDPILAPLAQSVPPSGFEAFPGLTAALTGFADGTIDATALETEASRTADQAAAAATQLEAIDGVGLVSGKGFDETSVLYVVNSQARLTQGMQLYAQAAGLAQDAATAPTRQARSLAERASAIADIAKGVFDDGYRDFVELQVRAGTYQPQIATP